MESKYHDHGTNASSSSNNINHNNSSSNSSSSSSYKRNPPEMYSSPQSTTTTTTSQNSKDKVESPPVPDSTTEPAPRPVQSYQEGDDVFYHADDGQLIFGSVGQVSGNSCQVLFGDGTQQWASFKRLKKLNDDPIEEATNAENTSLDRRNDVIPINTITINNSLGCNQSGPSRSNSVNGTTTNRSNVTEEFTCNSCGNKKRISAKKATKYQGDAKKDFHCRKCINASKVHETLNQGRFNGPLSSVSPEISIIPIRSQLVPKSIMPPPQVLSLLSNPTNPLTNQLQKTNLPCFHCEKGAEPYEKVYCNMCYEPCHLMCLGLNPVPLKGDLFWTVLCESCGNQIPNKKVKGVFSVRRNLPDWADVGHMIISCLSVKSSARMFNFDREMLPFLRDNTERLHLPRIYKNVEEDAQRKYLLNALKKQPLKFQNGQNASIWGLKETALGLDQKALIYRTAMGSGLKPKSFMTKPIEKELFAQSQAKNNKGHNQTNVSVAAQQSKAHNQKKEVGNGSLVLSSEGGMLINHLTGLEITPIPPPALADGKTTTLPPKGNVKTKQQSASGSEVKTENVRIKKEKVTIDSKKEQRKRVLSNGHFRLPTKRIKTDIEKSSSHSKVHKSSGAITNVSIDVELPSNSDSESEVNHSKKKRPLRILHRVAVKSPSKSPSKISNSSDESESSDSSKPAQDVNNIGFSQAIKSTSKVPLTPMQFKEAMSDPNEDVESDPEEEKIEKSPKKLKGRPPKHANTKQEKLKTPKTPIIQRLRQRTSTKRDDSGEINEHKPNLNTTQIAADKIKKKIKSSRGLKSHGKGLNGISRKIIPANHTCHCGNKNFVRDRGEVPVNEIDIISSSIYDGAMFGGYFVQCLPKLPLTEVERKVEALQVISNLNEEAEENIASILLRRGPGSETRSETRRKADIYYNRRKRDLNDYDSYDVLGKRLDPDGIVRYQVVWRHPGVPSYFTEDWETYYEQNFGWGNYENHEIKIPELPESPMIVEEGEDGDETSSGASSGFPVILDLTE